MKTHFAASLSKFITLMIFGLSLKVFSQHTQGSDDKGNALPNMSEVGLRTNDLDSVRMDCILDMVETYLGNKNDGLNLNLQRVELQKARQNEVSLYHIEKFSYSVIEGDRNVKFDVTLGDGIYEFDSSHVYFSLHDEGQSNYHGYYTNIKSIDVPIFSYEYQKNFEQNIFGGVKELDGIAKNLKILPENPSELIKFVNTQEPSVIAFQYPTDQFVSCLKRGIAKKYVQKK